MSNLHLSIDSIPHKQGIVNPYCEMVSPTDISLHGLLQFNSENLVQYASLGRLYPIQLVVGSYPHEFLNLLLSCPFFFIPEH